MKPLITSIFVEHPLLKPIAQLLDYEIAPVVLRHFPDEETYIQFQNSLQDCELIILESLERPDKKILPLLFMAETARALGAKRVKLCAPYLAYMRQDKQFNPGEGITSRYFAKLISHYFDALITVDPHLHRYHDLSEIYSIPTAVVHARAEISQWIQENVDNPLLIGPDQESEQWVAEIARAHQLPYLILEKKRYGDRAVEVSHPDIARWQEHTPILVDDIISTAHTMLATIDYLTKMHMLKPICIGVHAVFAENAYQRLCAAGVAQVVTCNTIAHSSNQIDLAAIISQALACQPVS